MEQLLLNLKLFGWREDDLTNLPEYVQTVSKAVGVPIPINTPIIPTGCTPAYRLAGWVESRKSKSDTCRAPPTFYTT
jgi:hypothetical protein